MLDIILSKFFRIPETGAPIQHIREVALLQPIDSPDTSEAILNEKKEFWENRCPTIIAIFCRCTDDGRPVLLELNSDDAMEAILNEKYSLPSIAFLSCLCVNWTHV